MLNTILNAEYYFEKGGRKLVVLACLRKCSLTKSLHLRYGKKESNLF